MTAPSSSPSMQTIVDEKNHWLCNQVEVLFPTPESLKGRELYLALNATQSVEAFVLPASASQINLDDIFLVDFHRLTIMFALLQASRCDEESQQTLLVEFFTQIIYSPPCALFLGFFETQPVAAAILTSHEQDLLISDIVIHNAIVFGEPREFAGAVIRKWSEDHPVTGNLYIELEKENQRER